MSLADDFRRGVAQMREAQESQRPLSSYAQHNNPKAQRDFVARLRTAVRLFLARSVRDLHKGRTTKAGYSAFRAGTYFAEYRRHYRHLRTL